MLDFNILITINWHCQSNKTIGNPFSSFCPEEIIRLKFFSTKESKQKLSYLQMPKNKNLQN